jgi:SAM-dependent methyltransferase
MNKSHLTALKRKSISQPTKYLLNKKLLIGSVLDFGCGQGRDAIETLADMYDPHYYPALPSKQYDTIYCNYVLNVIEDEDLRALVLLRIHRLLSNKGVAYITVRGDAKKLKGATKRGTWQGLIQLDLPIEKKTANWVMYRLTKAAFVIR